MLLRSAVKTRAIGPSDQGLPKPSESTPDGMLGPHVTPTGERARPPSQLGPILSAQAPVAGQEEKVEGTG